MGRFLGCSDQILGRWVGFLAVVWYFWPLLSLHSKMGIQQGGAGLSQIVMAFYCLQLVNFAVLELISLEVLAYKNGGFPIVSLDFWLLYLVILLVLFSLCRGRI